MKITASMSFLNLETQEKYGSNIIQAVHTTLMTYHKCFAASDELRMMTHTRGRARTCVYPQRMKRFITHSFSSQLNRILKTEPVQKKNRFRWIRYSEMDIPKCRAEGSLISIRVAISELKDCLPRSTVNN